MSTSTYFKILEIAPTKNRDVIKKAYRRLAMKYHPDRNHSELAKDKFITVNEAYEQILEALDRLEKTKSSPHTSTYTSNTSETKTRTTEANHKVKYRRATREEKMDFARRQYEKMQQKEAEETERYYQSLTTGNTWKYFKIILYISLFFVLLIVVDQYILPTKTYTGTIESATKEHPYYPEAIYLVQFDKGKPVYLKNRFIYNTLGDYDLLYISDGLLTQVLTDPQYLHLYDHFSYQLTYVDLRNIFYKSSSFMNRLGDNFIRVERTPIFKDIQEVSITYPHFNYTEYDVPHHDIITHYPLLIVILLLPCFAFFIKGRTVYFNLFFQISRYIIPFVLIYILLNNNHWFHLLTLGFF